MHKTRILTVDDDPDILDVLELTLSDHYEVFQARDGKSGLEMIQKKAPDLIICDYMMPAMNGRELCKAVKKDLLWRHIPIIMLTGKGEVHDRISGIEAGADDYIVKPFDPDELLARIKSILKRTVATLDANPLSHLPGNTSIAEEFQRCIDSGAIFAVAYADLDKFKAYNDKYGFEKGDEVIRELARILIKVVRGKGGPNAFIGHIGGDDMIFIVDNDIMDETCREVIREFDAKVPSFYPPEDRTAGYIISNDRQGKEQRFSLISISIGVVSNAAQKISHMAQISEIGAELKKYAKGLEKSNFVRDKRQGKNTP
jgi:diguanylate cyclase (GGDEF)-like protein